jgi:hypothetical protein
MRPKFILFVVPFFKTKKQTEMPPSSMPKPIQKATKKAVGRIPKKTVRIESIAKVKVQEPLNVRKTTINSI